MADNLPVDVEYEGEENQPSGAGISSSFFYNVPAHRKKDDCQEIPSERYAGKCDTNDAYT